MLLSSLLTPLAAGFNVYERSGEQSFRPAEEVLKTNNFSVEACLD